MMRLPIYQVDAFADRLFAGNPAAVVPLERWLRDETLLSIAAENNLSETAFFVPAGEGNFELRWFTPRAEVPLCGHATLATAFVLRECLGERSQTLRFQTRQSGELAVTHADGLYEMRLPRRHYRRVEHDPAAAEALGVSIAESFLVPVPGDDVLMVVLREWPAVRDLAPDLSAVAKLSWRSVLVTAEGGERGDFVSRYFAPRFGIDEDPVTGSAHCSLAPLWTERLGRADLVGHQISARGGLVRCRVEEDVVVVAGRGVLYLEGFIRVGAER